MTAYKHLLFPNFITTNIQICPSTNNTNNTYKTTSKFPKINQYQSAPLSPNHRLAQGKIETQGDVSLQLGILPPIAQKGNSLTRFGDTSNENTSQTRNSNPEFRNPPKQKIKINPNSNAKIRKTRKLRHRKKTHKIKKIKFSSKSTPTQTTISKSRSNPEKRKSALKN